MKRVLTLIGGIIGIVYGASGTIVTLTFFLFLLSFLGSPTVQLVIITVFAVGLPVTTLVLNILAVRCFACSAEQYAKQRKLLIATVVFNLLPSSSLLFLFFIGIAEFHFFGPVILLGIVASVLFIVDLCLERGRVAKITKTPLAEQALEQPGTEMELTNENP